MMRSGGLVLIGLWLAQAARVDMEEDSMSWRCENRRQCSWGMCVNIPVRCPVQLKVEIEGGGSVRSMDSISVDAKVSKVTITQGESIVKDPLNSNMNHVMPMLNDAVKGVVKDVNTEIADAVGDLKQELFDGIRKDEVGKYFTLINSLDAEDAISRALARSFSHMGGTFKDYTGPDKPELMDNWRDRLCHRDLRVKVKAHDVAKETDEKSEGDAVDSKQGVSNGEELTWVFKNWTNPIIAHKYDDATKCETLYTAQCKKGVVVKKKDCPFEEPQISTYCLWGSTCWRRHYTVQGSESKTISVPTLNGGDKPFINADLWVDHVEATPETEESAVVLTGDEDPLSKIDRGAFETDSELTLSIPDFATTIVEEMCAKVHKNAFFQIPFLGTARKWRCHAAMRSLASVASWTGDLKNKTTSVGADTRLKVTMKNDLRVKSLVEWDVLEKKAEEKAVEAAAKEAEKKPLPMRGKVQEIKLKLGGDKRQLFLKKGTYALMYAMLDLGF